MGMAKIALSIRPYGGVQTQLIICVYLNINGV